jgi:hypothetical protein
LYLDFSNGDEPKYRVPEHVPVPEDRMRPALPDVDSHGGLVVL